MGRDSERRVVVTGLGAVTPLGIGVEENWDNLVHGRSGIGPITKFDASELPCRIAGEVKNFDPAEWIPGKNVSKMDPFSHYAMASAAMAIADSGLDLDREDPYRVGVIIGSGIGGLLSLFENYDLYKERGHKCISPFLIPRVSINMAAANVAIIYGLKGLTLGVANGCSTGANAIANAYDAIKSGALDVAIAGASESTICAMGIGCFISMKAVSLRNDNPQKACRPFDKNRSGIVMSEGAAILALEDLEHAKNRNAPIYAELLGYGTSCDAYHITAPPADGRGAAQCMQNALRNAGIQVEEVDYINAHATGTKRGDVAETLAIKRVFGDHAYKLKISASKSMTGHAIGGASAMEAMFTALAVKNDVIPPTINLDEPDEECDLDYVPHEARSAAVKVAMSNSFGFGGTNISLVFGKY
ncbi:beta-ketoacyl-ACP synthase II [Dissulfurirhabdus thermomarina]|uniref:3-oxoacyl-[acyl-carrier-protein] synthase 2 n=1 Tax=Dissulfurirhabdus thermomarina TaxID=1765737 RepID=A0A6N9TPB1_DISTH|nr:beta-ketoacyl-ACP synthase II [Dissulfurirhabdus thermomarina]NDY41933.1 beta-ketoacyl-ACP synthase II [Dissulfurirhabdus thermomarina]NMX23119.1 beta-ketoacyl-ACP synthase II [Dissulfurirhabdus thermomarina]